MQNKNIHYWYSNGGLSCRRDVEHEVPAYLVILFVHRFVRVRLVACTYFPLIFLYSLFLFLSLSLSIFIIFSFSFHPCDLFSFVYVTFCLSPVPFRCNAAALFCFSHEFSICCIQRFDLPYCFRYALLHFVYIPTTNDPLQIVND